MAIFAAAGAKLFIGGPLAPNFSAPLTAADFIGQAWTEIAPLQQIGPVGDNAAVITFDALGDGRTHKLKGAKNAGTLTVVAGFDPNDPGQALAVAAAESPHSFATMIQPNDAPVRDQRGGRPGRPRLPARDPGGRGRPGPERACARPVALQAPARHRGRSRLGWARA